MADTPTFDENRERTIAWWLTFAVLATLTAVKPISHVPWIGSIAVTFAALIQLYLPTRRCDALGLDWSFIGLHMQTWRKDLKIVGILVAITFPPYALAYHFYMTSSHDWATALGLSALARYLPESRHLGLALPTDLVGWGKAAWAALTVVATHSLGVALPEETFYRGYLQPRLETRWRPTHRIFGVPMGRAAVIACALFALGHFLGEWNPLRFGPFLPALIFAWQRNATGSVFGSIVYHASCNVFGEILFTFYQHG